jgi:hypothetical protein
LSIISLSFTYKSGDVQGILQHRREITSFSVSPIQEQDVVLKRTSLFLATMLIASHVWAATQSIAPLSLSTSALTFNGSSGDVSRQPVTITATGSKPLVINALTFSNGTFSDSVPLPITLSPGQSYTFQISARPTTNTTTGTLTVVTNQGTSQIALAETGTTGYHDVILTWHAPNSSTAVAHYAIDRMRAGTSFHEVTEVPNTTLTWTDTQAKGGLTYLYRVRALSSEGDTSSPSNVITLPIP